jgi:hypothetical protein
MVVMNQIRTSPWANYMFLQYYNNIYNIVGQEDMSTAIQKPESTLDILENFVFLDIEENDKVLEEMERNNITITDEFPYPLTCRKRDQFHYLREVGLINNDDSSFIKLNKNVTIAIMYHVGMVNNWKTVLKDQMSTLSYCGLGDIADTLMVTYSNGDHPDLHHQIKAWNELPVVRKTFDKYGENYTAVSKGAPWEGTAIQMIYDYCINHLHPKTAIVYYFHNKGVSRYHPKWREQYSLATSYSRVLYWRKYLEYFLLERPQVCIHRLLNSHARTCAANWHVTMKNHYSGNMWSTTCCDYVNELTEGHRPSPNASDYWYAEFWLGKHPHPRPEWYSSITNTGLYMYDHLAFPHKYTGFNLSCYDYRHHEVFNHTFNPYFQ